MAVYDDDYIIIIIHSKILCVYKYRNTENCIYEKKFSRSLVNFCVEAIFVLLLLCRKGEKINMRCTYFVWGHHMPSEQRELKKALLLVCMIFFSSTFWIYYKLIAFIIQQKQQQQQQKQKNQEAKSNFFSIIISIFLLLE